MKRTFLAAIPTVLIVLTLSWILAPTAALAEEEAVIGEITKIERVRATGIGCLGIRLFGGWATAPEEPSLFGAASTMFRLNSDNKTTFRGLGRENGFAQRIFPTLHSRPNLQKILSENTEARSSLTTFDAQVATGEKIHMASTAAVVAGKITIITGIVMMFSDPDKSINIYKIGVVLWGAGRFGQLGGTIVTKQAFAHLNNATRAYNESR